MDMRHGSTRKHGRDEEASAEVQLDSSFMMAFPAWVCSAMKETLLAIEGEVDFYLGFGHLRIGGEVPAFDGIFCCSGEQGVA
jgi:hypothetical protein